MEKTWGGHTHHQGENTASQSHCSEGPKLPSCLCPPVGFYGMHDNCSRHLLVLECIFFFLEIGIVMYCVYT